MCRKNGAGLYRAGVAELQRHIIRISMMSTKIGSPARFMVDVGKMEAMRVSHVEICMILSILQLIMLLLDLFIYLNFEQKQQAVHHRQFVDIHNLHGKNIAPVVLFITLYPSSLGIVLLSILTKKHHSPSLEGE